MGKYDVDILVKAKDAVAPGLDSAKGKLNKFQDDFVNKAAKTLATIGGIEAGFKGLTGVVELLRGNTDNAMAAFESLPFGIGPAIKAGHDLVKAFSGVNEKLEAAKLKLRDVLIESKNIRIGLFNAPEDRRQLDAIGEQYDRQRKKLEDSLIDLSGSALKKGQAAVNAELKRLNKEHDEQSFKIRADFSDKQILAERKRHADIAKVAKEAQEKLIADEQAAFLKRTQFVIDSVTKQKQLENDRVMIQLDGLAEWDEAVKQSDEHRAQRGVAFGKFLADQQRDPESKLQLSGGSQSRFLTGAADVARDRIASEHLTTAKASKELLARAVSVLDTIARSPLGISVGIF